MNNNYTKHMTIQDIQKEAREEFENLERKTERGMWWVRLDRVKKVSDSLIQKAVLQERERIVGVIEDMIAKNTKGFPFPTIEEDVTREIISRITNESGINKLIE